MKKAMEERKLKEERRGLGRIGGEEVKEGRRNRVWPHYTWEGIS